MAFFSLLDPVLNPILVLHPFWAILILSFMISLVMILIYKWMTNQEQMKSLKDDIKRYQKEMKEHKNNPKQAMEIQKKAMDANMKYMGQSMKPTFVSFLPIILIFGWMNAHLAYEPLVPGEEFNVQASFSQGIFGNATIKVPDGFKVDSYTQEIINGKANWSLTAPELKNPEGDNYILEFENDGEVVSKDILITYKLAYKETTKSIRDSRFTMINVFNRPMKPLGSISIFGWLPGWLGVYIITSIIFSMSLRKLLKLH
jgi:uncharacterized membrane protein (DUF106 family)